MGAKTPVTEVYQRFLNTAKVNYRGKGEKNFFNYKHIKLLSDALNAEIKKTREQLRGKKDDEVEDSDDIFDSFSNVLDRMGDGAQKLAAKVTKSVTGDQTEDSAKVDLGTIKRLRRENRKKEYTPFLQFAETAKAAINNYLNIVGSYSLDFEGDFQGAAKNLSQTLSDALKNYRHKAKSHHYFRSTVGRAEIANKITGGSLESWLKHSFKELSSPGIEIKISPSWKYICRKATQDEEDRHKDNKGRPRFFQYKHVIQEIVPIKLK